MVDADALEVKQAAGGCRLRVHVRPGARSDNLLGVHGGALKLSVVEPPERGRANEAVARLLASSLGLPRGAVEVVAGLASRNKTVRISGLTARDLIARLERL